MGLTSQLLALCCCLFSNRMPRRALARSLEHGIHAVFPASARERIDLSLAEVHAVAASFADAKARAASTFANAHMRMRAAVEALGEAVESTRYNLNPVEFEAMSEHDPVVDTVRTRLAR